MNESNEELRRDNLNLLPFIFGGPKFKKERLARLARDRQRRYRSWLVNLGDQVERWRERCTRVDDCDRKLAKMLLDKWKKWVPDTSYLIDRSSEPEPYV